ncbi:MAG: DUF493 domain-containing protein [Halioglobus sp.]
MTEEQEPPKIEFPCEYPIKVLGKNVDEFSPAVLAVFERHAAGFDHNAIATKTSSKATFISMTITITATGPEQLTKLHQDLMATGLVHMVI